MIYFIALRKCVYRFEIVFQVNDVEYVKFVGSMGLNFVGNCMVVTQFISLLYVCGDENSWIRASHKIQEK